MPDFLNTFIAYLGTLSPLAWFLIGAATIIIGVITLIDDDDDTEEDFLATVEKEVIQESERYTLTCSVPGQQVIILKPHEFETWQDDGYNRFEVTLTNGLVLDLPTQYTTIIPDYYYAKMNPLAQAETKSAAN